MVRLKSPDMAVLYTAGERFVDAALRSDGSLFTPGAIIWSRENLADLYSRFIDQPVESVASFEEKLKQQLAGASAATIQLMSELLFVHFLAAKPKSMGPSAKQKTINTVLSWSPEPVSIPKELVPPFNAGIASTGIGFNTGRYYQLWMLLKFVLHWKDLSNEDREQALSDPWAFKALVEKAHVQASRLQEGALLHLVYPDVFESIISLKMKQDITEHFPDLVGNPDEDIDKQLGAIRAVLSEKYGQDFSFYDEQVKLLWGPEAEKWDDFTFWARRFKAYPTFDKEERDYKLLVAQNLQAARAALISGSADWQTLINKAFGTPNNLTPWQMDDKFRKWCTADPESAISALRTIWDENKSIPERIKTFLEKVPKDAYDGMQVVIASFLLMADDPRQSPIFRKTIYEKGYQLTGFAFPTKGADAATIYLNGLSFLDRIVTEAETRELHLRDRLDAQGVLWCIVKWDRFENWTKHDRQAFLKFRGDIDADDEEYEQKPDSGSIHNGGGGNAATPATPPTLAELAEALYLEQEFLARVGRLLEDKGQVIFYGPPGTGKTYVAQALAEYYAGHEGTVEIVQFHPSYSYEDFVEGYRPDPDGGQGFALVNGPLKRIAAAAREKPEATHILIIDEINRGNVAKVFGELYFLLEYRDKGVTLQYARKPFVPFSLPKNLWVIGTMNTADRSIALIDAALRRRFYFVPFFPDEEPIKNVLRRWLQKEKPDLLWLADIVEAANQHLEDRQAAIGPSYFMKETLTDEWIEIIWEYAIIPYLAEKFYGNEDALKQYALSTLRASVDSKVQIPTALGGEHDTNPDAN